jgi:chromosome partitioning protein
VPIIAVINRKGGSGKSTMATHLAAWMALQGLAVMLGDIDRQQSTRAWLRRRAAHLPVIVPWALDQKNVLRVPTGVTHAVLDTPGGLQGFELAKLVMSCDAILMPVCNSLFDRESAASCIAELRSLPRVATGRCKLAIVGMRIDSRTNAAKLLQDWAQTLAIPFLVAVREAQVYVRSLESGTTIFDLPPALQGGDPAQWLPIFRWLGPLVQAATPAEPALAGPNRSPLRASPQVGDAAHETLQPSRSAVLAPGNIISVGNANPSIQYKPAEMPVESQPLPQFLLRQ